MKENVTEQKLLKADGNYRDLDRYLCDLEVKRILLVCGKSIHSLKINSYFETLKERLGIKVIRYSDFQPNPLYESVVHGVEVFTKEKCDMIVAVGGGSAMDVAKCIKLFSNMEHGKNYLQQNIVPNNIPFLAVPTTAGTGSEATRFAVIYYQGEKQSVSDYSSIPQAVLVDVSVLKSLPDYQRKATMLDAFGHAIESFWSVNSTMKSKEYARKAIRLVLENKDLYLQNIESGNEKMLEASNLAGKAINITQTTAGHAMCYKLTSLYGIAHGHAVALCIAKLWPYMVENTDKCIDSRGKEYLDKVFGEIADIMGCKTVEQAIQRYDEFLTSLCLEKTKASENDIEILKHSVNPVRLKNNPVAMDVETIEKLYRQILSFN